MTGQLHALNIHAICQLFSPVSSALSIEFKKRYVLMCIIRSKGMLGWLSCVLSLSLTLFMMIILDTIRCSFLMRSKICACLTLMQRIQLNVIRYTLVYNAARRRLLNFGCNDLPMSLC